jgi:streptogramin lyase
VTPRSSSPNGTAGDNGRNVTAITALTESAVYSGSSNPFRTRRTMSARRILTATAASVAAVGATLAAASPAAANESYHQFYTVESGVPAAMVTFTEHGDVITLYDNDNEGVGVHLSVKVGSSYKYDLHVGGFGSATSGSASMGGKYNLPEDANITIFVWATSADGFYHVENEKTYYNDH